MFLYVNYNDLSKSGYLGVKKKIIAQSKVFEKVFGVAYYTSWNSQVAYLMHNEQIIEKEPAVSRMDYLYVLLRWIEKYDVKKTYIRYPLSDKYFVELLQYQKKNHIKSILEIPTFPYDDELSVSRVKEEDAYYREFAKCYIDRISTYSSDYQIWGRSCINLTNGINWKEYAISKKVPQKGTVTMIAVAGEFSSWNGFERVIKGLAEYMQSNYKCMVKLILVGQAGDESYYRTLVKEYGICENVEFTGRIEAAELDEVFDKADVAVSTLGLYKKNINEASPIKGAEYCAKGFPIICGYKDIRFREGLEFILNVPNDDTPLDIQKVIEFYENISKKENYKQIIRKYAEEYLSWDSIMQPVIDYFKEI